MAFDLSSNNDLQDDVTAQAFGGPAPAQTFHDSPPQLTRADTADYLDRANWNPDQARALAARERLSNLGVHPDVVAQAVPPVGPQAAPAVRPTPPKAQQRSLAPAALVSPRPVPTTRVLSSPTQRRSAAAQAAAPVDFSAGLVPKQASRGATDDFTAGLVPKTGPTRGIASAPAGTISKKPQKIDFSDLGGIRVNPAAQKPGAIDFSDLGGRRVPATEDIDLSAGFVPKQSTGDAGGDIDLSAGFVPIESQPAPQDKGLGSQAVGAVKGPFIEVGQTLTGLKDLFAEPQNDDEKTIQEGLIGQHGALGGRIAMAAYRMGHGFLSQLEKAKQVSSSEESIQGKVLGAAENAPMIGDLVKKMESGDYGEAITQGVMRALMMKFGTNKGGAAADLPKAATIAGAEIPLKASQALEAAGKTGLAKVAGTIEPIAENLPGGGVLRKVSEAQQAGAREGLANKAATTGAVTSKAPEAIEKNWTDAIAETKKTAQAKYEDIRTQAEKADITPVTTAAQSILDDTETAKLLPKAAREALNKVTKSLSDRDSIAKQIYGKAFNDLDPAKQGEVGKAVQSLGKASEPAGMSDAMQARSELSDAANSAADANTQRLLQQATNSLDESIDKSLEAHDAANGTDLKGQRLEANQLWAKKYAMQEWRDGLQKVMEDQPSQGGRTINGKKFQELVNRLDPPGGREKRSSLELMTADNPQSLKDIHELADWMGKNQTRAGGGFATFMAKLRMLSLPASLIGLGVSAKSTLGLLGSSAVMAQILARPGVAGGILKGLQAGVETTKGAAAIGEVANILGVSKPANETPAVGFAKPEMEEHKLTGMRAAAASPNTPEHLREHLQKMTFPQKGNQVRLPSGQVATVEYSAPDDKLPIVRVRTNDGKTVRLTRQRDIDKLAIVKGD